MNTSSVYTQPRNKSMEAASYFKRQQRIGADEYEAFYGESAPAWVRANVKDIASHIDMVFDAAKEHGVQLKWQQIEYGSTWQQICEAAKAKQSYKYAVGDYLPREADRLDTKPVAMNNTASIRDYFGVFYITINDCAAGFYQDKNDDYATAWSCNNMVAHDFFAVRFSSYDEAKAIFDQIVA